MLYNSDAYNDFLNAAAKDDRVGKHDGIVLSVVHDKWPSGDDRHKIMVGLLTAGNAKADLTWSPPPPVEELNRLKDSKDPDDRGKKQAIAKAINLARQAATHYGKAVTDFREGDRIRVETVKTKRDNEGGGGFIRVVALLPPNAENGSAPAGSGPGF
jgi:hypothetical protein